MEMDNKAKASAILNLISDQIDHANSKVFERIKDSSGWKAARAEWDLQNPDDGVGGMSQNPYSEEAEQRYNTSLQSALKNRDEWKEIYHYAVATFIS